MVSRYCVFCRKPLSAEMRKDAAYCSNNCRVRASYFRRHHAEDVDKPPTAAPVIERARKPRGASKRAPAERPAPVPVELLPPPHALPTRLLIEPYPFAERFPQVWLADAMLACAPPRAVGYVLRPEPFDPARWKRE